MLNSSTLWSRARMGPVAFLPLWLSLRRHLRDRLGAQPASRVAAVAALTQTGQIRSLSAAEAARGLPVRVTGVVTYYNPDIPDIFLQGEGGRLCYAELPKPVPGPGTRRFDPAGRDHLRGRLHARWCSPENAVRQGAGVAAATAAAHPGPQSPHRRGRQPVDPAYRPGAGTPTPCATALVR
jgi:hypothetical protein